MTFSEAEMKTVNARLDGAAAILEYLTSAHPIQQRNALKRVLADVVRAWPVAFVEIVQRRLFTRAAGDLA